MFLSITRITICHTAKFLCCFCWLAVHTPFNIMLFSSKLLFTEKNISS